MSKVINISTATEGASLYYSTDGSTPGTAYSSEITLTDAGSYTITAVAKKEGYLDSEVVTESVAITPSVTLDLSALMNLSSMDYFSNTSLGITGYTVTPSLDYTYSISVSESSVTLPQPTITSYLDSTYGTVDLSDYISWYADSNYTTTFDFSSSISSDITLYVKSNTEYVKGTSGTTGKVHAFVSSADELSFWNSDVQSTLSLGCVLLSDVDFSNYAWTMVGTMVSAYTGTFDGSDHTINGIAIESTANYSGVFRYVGSAGVIQNVNLENLTVSGTGYTAGIAGHNYGTISNCKIYGTISATGSYTGGITGYNRSSGTIEDCVNYCSVTTSGYSTSNYTGGIAGYNYGTITGCVNNEAITGNSYVGGISGADTSGSVIGCVNYGVILGTDASPYSYIGGIVGMGGGNNSGTFVACYNIGTVQSSGTHVGGISGRNGALTAACYNVGSISGSDIVAGIIALNYDSSTVTDCYYSSSSASTGVASNSGTSSTTAVSTTSAWSSAGTTMNTYLTNNGYNYQYTYTGDESEPLTLSKTS